MTATAERLQAAKSSEATQNVAWQLVVSGATYDAALSHVEPVDKKVRGFGFRVTLRAPDRATYEDWLDLIAEAAADLADRDDWDTHRALVKDMDRAGQ